MVSSDFGKLDGIRQRSSGIAWAIAGLGNVAAATAPAAAVPANTSRLLLMSFVQPRLVSAPVMGGLAHPRSVGARRRARNRGTGSGCARAAGMAGDGDGNRCCVDGARSDRGGAGLEPALQPVEEV